MALKKHNPRRIYAFVLAIVMIGSIVLAPFATKVEAAAQQRDIGGKLINGVQEPLKVTVKNNGELAAYLWQGNGYVGQYFGNEAWGTNLFYTESGTVTRQFSPYFAGNQSTGKNVPLGEGIITMPDEHTIVVTWQLDSGELELKQTIYYPENERYMEKEWSVENKSATKTYSNLKLFHGGDTMFGGEDSAKSYWDPILNMVYVKNDDMSRFGLMGFAGKNTSPADRYYGGDFRKGNTEASNGQLSNSVNSENTDAGYQLQWDRQTLGTNEKWVVQSTEMWTTAGSLQIIAPPSQTTAPNSTVVYPFKLQNFQKDADVFDLYATSANGWKVNIVEGTSVTVPGNGAIKTVTVEVQVPAGAAGTDTITLTGTSQKDQTITNVGSATTTINAALPVISSVTAVPNKAAVGTAINIPVEIQTANVLDGAAVQVELVDENKRSLSPAITGSGAVTNNKATVVLPVTDVLNLANYYIKVKVDGVSAIHSSTQFAVTESNNADLLSIFTTPGTISPAFDKDITDYAVSVTEDVYSITVTGAVYDPRSTLQVNGVKVVSNQPSDLIPLKTGDNVIQVEVTAPDGTTKKTYTLKVNKQPSRNAQLLHTTVSPGTLSPAFSSGTTEYEVNVGHETDQLSVTDLVYSPKANISVVGATYDPLTGGYTFPLQVGINELKVIVTAEDGLTQTVYTIKATRQSKESEVAQALKELSIGYAKGDSWESVTKNVILPTEGKYNTAVKWTSSDPSVLNEKGEVTPSPDKDTTVWMTATVEKDGVKATRTFLVIVKKGSLQIVKEDSSRTVPIQAGNDAESVENNIITRKTMSDGTKIDKVVVDPAKTEYARVKAQANNHSSIRLIAADLPNDPADEVAVEVPIAAYSPLANGLNLVIETAGAHVVLDKATLHQLMQDGNDLFFRFVPIRAELQKKALNEQAINDAVVKQTAGTKRVKLVGTPMIIETNYSDRETKLVFPLDKLQAPTDPVAQAAYLKSLYVYIQHSDGSKDLKQGVIERDAAGNVIGMSIVIHKFSTFTIVKMDAVTNGGGSTGGIIPPTTGGTKETDKDKDKDSNKDNHGVKTVQHKPYIKGFKDGTFRPEKSITRAELAVMLWKLSEGKAASTSASTSSFKDVQAGHWAFAAIQSLSAKGIMIGVGEESFEPNRPLTRAEMAATAARWKQLVSNKPSSFKDVQGHWAEKHITALVEAGAAHGYKDGSYRPDASITRAEAVKLVNRLLERGPLFEVTKPTWRDVLPTHWAYGDIEEASQSHTAEVVPAKGEKLISK
ncbi:S-layer homology domain-containing protein [Paenibacillus assamensis]|uniref:S-layer homology domain-containing protein n=1 Tax=Paenibacillus assamensis TaxID=311244 RepID=UPI0004272558|nr:S-layer homology domain-containing protein [Paenibacillus assamensis]